jgi:hypothetical protein
MSNLKLLVPMYMEALALSNDKKDGMNLSPQWENYAQSILGNVLQPDNSRSLNLEKGIHLHWSLPKALKHSFIVEGGETKFPYAPNRWMIVRIRTDKGTKDMPSRMWIIKSDENNDFQSNNLAPNWVVLKDNKLTFKNLGQAFEWVDTYDDKIAEPVLTGVGAADPYFASFYPSCKNVFGFHDDMKDIDSNCTVTYIVNGWYSDPAQDPLAPLDFKGVPKTEEQIDKNKKLEWFKTQWKYDGEYPESCLLHSAITSLKWNDQLKSGVPDEEVQVYAGNTAIESLSAQIIKSNDVEKSGVEELLNALQYQLLEDKENEPGLASIQKEIHKMGFSPKNRNSFWEISRVEADDKHLEEKQDERPHFPENPALLKDLKDLNKAQIDKNSKEYEILSLQQEYYFLWYKEANKTVNNDQVPGFDYENSRKIILDKIVEAKVDKDLYTTEIDQYIKKLNAELLVENQEFELKEKLEDRFWEPNDPVLLLCGTGVGNIDKPIFQTANKEINCRVENQIITKLPLKVPYDAIFIPVDILSTAFTVPKVNTLANDKIPFGELKKLVYETLLLDSSLALDIALEAYNIAQQGKGKDKTSSIIIEFSKTVIEAQLNPVGHEGVLPEEFAKTKWKQAWTPLFMVWDVVYTPHDQDIKNMDVLENTAKWKLEDGLYFKNQSVKGTGQNISIQGISPLSNSVSANLKRMVPDSIADKYGELSLIAQSLSGLHKYLLMQRPDIQLPPFKYTSDAIYNFESEYLIDQDELNMIGEDGYLLGINPGNKSGKEANIFNPLRSGVLKIKNLSIVDAFGQAKRVIIENDKANPKVTCSITLKGDEKKGDQNIIPLPPRIIQPSRLQFNWLNAKDEVIYQDAGKMDSPVLGWLVPNYLDKSIMVYDGAGNEVIILQITVDITKDKGFKLLKRSFPGRNATPSPADNLQLKKVLDNINSGSIATGIMDLAYKINLNITGGSSLQNNTAALLCGQPIAVVRCSIKLESLGLPYFNQRWDKSGKEDTGNIETVKFPLGLGNYTLEKDGLLGYFTDTDNDSFYTTFKAPDFKFSKSESFFKKDNTLKIALNQDPVKVNLLMDPSAGVHLSTGILPTKFVELFNHNSAKLLSGLNISFMIAPFIADKVDPGIPIPSSINADWKWTHKSDVTTWQSDADIAEGKTKQLSGLKKQQVYEGWLRLNNLKTNN